MKSGAPLFIGGSQNLPKAPQPEVGRTYALNNHGSVVYLTKDEDSRLNWLQAIALLSAIAGGVLGRRFGMFSDSLRGLSADRRYNILHGPKLDYEEVRDTYKEKDN